MIGSTCSDNIGLKFTNNRKKFLRLERAMAKRLSKRNVEDKPHKGDVLAHNTVSIEELISREYKERPECGSKHETCSCYKEGRCDGIFSAFCCEYED